MQLSKSVLLLTALSAGTVSGRAAHKHKHRHADLHEERSLGDKVVAVIDGATVTWENTYSGETGAPVASSYTATPTTTKVKADDVKASSTATYSASSSAAATSAASSGDSSPVYTEYTEFCSAAAKAKRATAAQIAYTGNTGTSDDWGCNMQLVAADIADQYDYTIKVTGQNTESWKFVCWNKIGPDGLIDGWYNHTAVSFDLAPGATQYVAFQANSQGACASQPGNEIETDSYGGFVTTWFEFDFANESNDNWSGADVSSIQAEAAGTSVYGMRACSGDVCSTIGADMSILDNAFSNALKLADGLGLNLPAGPVSIDVVIDYSP
ncbi:uncharacterized protein BCR38DRAFT_126190 [Pseudomassariella vexata]|uniref:Allergen Asp f 4 n=1 Tax=Pseudomassariella vexata TaxID=1141098 RepID=A0A1Y2D9F9_9PEZI|nr:uncharacterized protein BCR38DRAFT_126190 [Pseudomassariella vexata]ORY55285.1 hypothetical protein BCR38DRAFT_126190 [Pseudomassariella vexata]